jgi:hypothetical protein
VVLFFQTASKEYIDFLHTHATNGTGNILYELWLANGKGPPVDIDLGNIAFSDCNENGVLDACDIANGTLHDVNGDGYPDECVIHGDVNCDGNVDFFDIDPFLLVLFDPTGYADQYPGCPLANADCNSDNSVDFFDIDPFLNCLFNGCP